MTDTSAQSRRGDISIFLPQAEDKEKHILVVLIEERCPTFSSHWTWPMLRLPILSMLGYRKARRMADYIHGMPGGESFDYLSEELKIDLDLTSFDRIPKTGRVVIAANQPSGLADGSAVWAALRKVRKDIVFFANADAIRINPGFETTLIPVEWVLEKRSPRKARETLRRAADAFAEEKCVVIFPSGKLARMVNKTLTEQDWFPTVVSLARKQKAPILPLNVQARNSSLYYFLSRHNGELRDITLFRELVNKKGDLFRMTAGDLIAPDKLAGDAADITLALKNYVSYDLSPDSPDKVFDPARPHQENYPKIID